MELFHEEQTLTGRLCPSNSFGHLPMGFLKRAIKGLWDKINVEIVEIKIIENLVRINENSAATLFLIHV